MSLRENTFKKPYLINGMAFDESVYAPMFHLLWELIHEGDRRVSFHREA